jgi:hypothetical protein
MTVDEFSLYFSDEICILLTAKFGNSIPNHAVLNIVAVLPHSRAIRYEEINFCDETDFYELVKMYINRV